MRKIFAFSFVLTFSSVMMNFVTGVIGARVLGPEGRGALSAILVLPGVATWIFGLGALQALTYFVAKDSKRASKIVSSWAALMLPMALLAAGACAVAVAPVMAAQTEETRQLGLLWAPTVLIAVYANILNGAILGLHKYRSFAILLPLQNLALTASFCGLAAFGHLTVSTALLCNLLGSLCSLCVSAFILFRSVRLSKPTLDTLRETLPFGLKANGTNVGQAMNNRLDLLIMPAILSAAVVGQYSLATSLAYVILQIAAAIAPIVMPAAVREGGGRTSVWKGMRATLLVAGGLGIAGLITADLAIRIVYGAEFAEAALAFRILVPGIVLFAASQILWSGIYAAGKPMAAFLAQLPGLLVTGVGLALFLEPYGLVGASIVSSLSYTAVFATSLFAFLRVTRDGSDAPERDVLFDSLSPDESALVGKPSESTF